MWWVKAFITERLPYFKDFFHTTNSTLFEWCLRRYTEIEIRISCFMMSRKWMSKSPRSAVSKGRSFYLDKSFTVIKLAKFLNKSRTKHHAVIRRFFRNHVEISFTVDSFFISETMKLFWKWKKCLWEELKRTYKDSELALVCHKELSVNTDDITTIDIFFKDFKCRHWLFSDFMQLSTILREETKIPGKSELNLSRIILKRTKYQLPKATNQHDTTSGMDVICWSRNNLLYSTEILFCILTNIIDVLFPWKTIRIEFDT